MGDIDYRVLGPLEVQTDGQAVELGGVQQRRLLAVLLANAGRVVATAELREVLWPDGEAPNSDAALRTYVSRLRRALGVDPIRTMVPGYRLDLAGASLDADRFGELAAAARARASDNDHDGALERADAALALWRGRPYLEFATEGWARGEVARLDELHLSLCEERFAALIALGRGEVALAQLERSVSDQPLRERLVAQLALARYRAGRQAEALRGLAEHRRLLAEQTGLEPGPELARLEGRILAHDPSLQLPEPTGTRLRSYLLGEQLGQGAFAEVFRGTQPSVGRTVAVKVIRPELANRPEFIRRFEAEAHLVARLEHPHIVPLYDYWREPDRAFLVMRLLRGGTLEQYLSDRGPLPLPTVLTMATQVGAALHAAHRAGIVHRDVKPANVFLDGDGNFYLGDFGIALEVADAGGPEASLSAGSPAYASPEQLRRQPVGPPADIFGLGVTLYEALTARLPFPDETTQAGLLRRQLHDPVPLVSGSVDDLPAGVDDVVQRATAKQPTERYQQVDELVTALTAALRPAAPDSTGRAARPGAGMGTALALEAPNPYKGLLAFTEADAADFFGRDRLVDQLLGLLRRPGTSGRVLAVVGPSGIGKSSVVRAGLLPALRRGAVGGSDRWFVASMLPGGDPFGELAPALVRLAADQPVDLARALSEDRRGLARVVKAIVPADGELLLVVDQFEELFTLTVDEAVRRRFLQALEYALTDQRCPLRLVLTLRADFYDRPLRYGDFARLLRDSTVPVLPLAADELERAVVDPAGRVGCSFEPGLVSQIVADVADQPSALPILQYALTELYERRVSGLLLTSAYEAMGGVTGALAQRAEELYEAAVPDEQAATRRLFGRLVVTLGEGVEDTRRRVPRPELGGGADVDAVVERYGAARLLSFDRDPLSREPTVEVAHEALIREWPRLRAWLDEDRDSLRTQRHLTEASRAWERAGRDPGELYRGGRLDAALEWAQSCPDEANELERAFLDAGRALRDDEQNRLRRTNRRLRALLAGVGVTLVLALAAGALAAIQQRRASSNANEARRQADEAAAERVRAEDAAVEADDARALSDVRRLVAEAKVAEQRDLSLSSLLAVEAHRRLPSPATLGALESALVSDPRVLRLVPGPWSRALSAITADGRELLVARADGRIERLDTTTLARIGEPFVASDGDGDGDTEVAVAAGDDPSSFVTLDLTGTVTFWNRTTGALSSRRTLPGASMAAVVRDPPLAAARDGGGALVGVPGGVVFVPARGEDPVRPVISGMESPVLRLALDPGGTRLAIGTADLAITVVDVDTGAVRIRFPTGLQGATSASLAWSPDGAVLAQGNGGSSGPLGALYDAATGQRLSPPFTEVPTPVGAFVANGGMYAHGSSNGVVQLRHPTNGALLEPAFPSFVGIVRNVLASPDGSRLYVVGFAGIAVVSLDGRLKLGRRMPFPVVGHSGGRTFGFDPRSGRVDLLDADLRPTGGFIVPDFRPDALLSPQLEFSPDGARFAAGSANGTISVIDVASGGVQLRFPIPFTPPDSRFFASMGPAARNWVGFVRWSPDGKTIAAGRWDRVYLFDAASGALLREVAAGWKEQLTSVSFSPDGRRLLVGSFEGTGLVVDPATGQVVGEPLGVGGFAAAMLSWTPDGRGIAITDNNAKTVRVVDAETRQPIQPIVGDFAANLAWPWFTEDGERMIVGGSDGLVRMFDRASGEEIGDGMGIPGRQLVGGAVGTGGRVFIQSMVGPAVETTLWETDPAGWLPRACETAGRNLTEEEWTRYLPDAGLRRPTCEQWPLR